MEKFYPYFPLSSGVVPGNLKTVVISVLIYLAACAIMSILEAILGWIPIVGGLVRLILSVLGLYCVAGIILSILKYFQRGTN